MKRLQKSFWKEHKGGSMQFHTERLIIRKPYLEDAQDLFRNYTQDPEVCRYMTWKPHEDIEKTKEWLSFCIRNWDENRALEFVIWHRESAQAIGMAGIRIDDFKGTMGYVLARPWWNKGIVTEACRPLVAEIISREEIYRIEAFHDTENPASGRVMEKLGMKKEGILKRYARLPNLPGRPRDYAVYALTK